MAISQIDERFERLIKCIYEKPDMIKADTPLQQIRNGASFPGTFNQFDIRIRLHFDKANPNTLRLNGNRL